MCRLADAVWYVSESLRWSSPPWASCKVCLGHHERCRKPAKWFCPGSYVSVLVRSLIQGSKLHQIKRTDNACSFFFLW